MTIDWFDLSGRTALVTGAGHGIGEGIAEAFAAVGARVIVADIDQGNAERVAQKVGGVALRLDVSDEQAVEAAFADIAEDGGVDILVNNAGVFDGLGVPLHEFTTDMWRRVTSVNLDGVFFCARAAARLMIAAGKGGRIINISSTQATAPGGGIAYDGTKAAIIQMSRSMALDFGAHRINVNTIAPGPIWSEPGPAPDLRGAPLLPFDSPGAQSINRHLANLPQDHWGVPLDVGKAAVFLASSMGDRVTGALLHVDGGWTVL